VGKITSGADLSFEHIWIEFHDRASFCATRLDWHLTDRSTEISSGKRQQLAAGNEDNGRSFSVFRIEKHGADVLGYKLVVCAKKEACQGLGVYASKDKTWLGVSDELIMVCVSEEDIILIVMCVNSQYQFSDSCYVL
jgi:hypothetical protein